MQYLGISLGCCIVIGILVCSIHRKTHRNRVHDIIIVKDSEDSDDFDLHRSSKASEAEVADDGATGTYRNFEDRPNITPLYSSNSSGAPPSSSNFMGYEGRASMDGGQGNTDGGQGNTAVLGAISGFSTDY